MSRSCRANFVNYARRYQQDGIRSEIDVDRVRLIRVQISREPGGIVADGVITNDRGRFVHFRFPNP